MPHFQVHWFFLLPIQIWCWAPLVKFSTPEFLFLPFHSSYLFIGILCLVGHHFHGFFAHDFLKPFNVCKIVGLKSLANKPNVWGSPGTVFIHLFIFIFCVGVMFLFIIFCCCCKLFFNIIFCCWEQDILNIIMWKLWKSDLHLFWVLLLFCLLSFVCCCFCYYCCLSKCLFCTNLVNSTFMFCMVMKSLHG